MSQPNNRNKRFLGPLVAIGTGIAVGTGIFNTIQMTKLNSQLSTVHHQTKQIARNQQQLHDQVQHQATILADIQKAAEESLKYTRHFFQQIIKLQELAEQ
ncbi:Hypothetical predicted protein, partial [Paramuricea clavata]